MQILLDTHTHTNASSHAYSTILENAKFASEKGLKLLCVTDHAPAIADSADIMYYWNLHILDRELFGIEMMYGVELSILDYNGTLDLDEDLLKKMDICIASFHNVVLTPGTKKENTMAMLKAMQNPYVAILGHPDDGKILVEYEELVLEAKRSNVLLEVNNSSITTAFYRLNTRENLVKMLGLCEKYGVKVSLGSDAHFATSVGRLDDAISLLEEIKFPHELVINTSVEAFKKHLGDKK